MSVALDLLYENYLDKVDFLERNKPLGAGIFGMKGGPADDPCHDRFAEDLADLLGRLAESKPEPSEVQDTLRKIFFEPKKHVNLRAAYWMLLAVHGLTGALTERLSPEDAKALYDAYTGRYKRWERLPNQIELLKKLKART